MKIFKKQEYLIIKDNADSCFGTSRWITEWDTLPKYNNYAVKIKAKTLSKKLDNWCKENLIGKYDYKITPFELWFFLELDSDTMLFKLRWS